MNHDEFQSELEKTLDYLLDGRINKDDAVRGIMHDIKRSTADTDKYMFALSKGIVNNPQIHKQATSREYILDEIEAWLDDLPVRGADIEDPARDEENFLDIHIEKVDPDD